MDSSKKLEILLTAKDTASKTLKGFAGGLAGVAKKAAKATAAIAAIGAAAAAAFSVKAVKAAIDLGESINAVEKTFGDASSKILEFGETADKQAGLSKAAFNSAVVPIGAMLQNMGIEAENAADESINLGKRAADLASVFNTDLDTALTAIQAGLRGEADPLEKFGVGLKQSAVKAYALENGLVDVGGEMDDTSRATAALGLFMEQTDKFAGDFVDTSDQAANKQRILEARMENVSATIGQKLLPVWKKLLDAGEYMVNNVLPKVTQWIDKAKDKFEEWRPAIVRTKDQIIALASQVADYLIPKFTALWNTISTKLIPAVKDFWQNYIEPLLPVLGVALVGAIGLATDALNIIITSFGWLIDAINNGNPIIWGMIGAFGALKIAMGMEAVFTAITVGFTTMTTVTIPGALIKIAALRAAVTSPMALAVIGVGAAVMALQWLRGEAEKTRAAIEAAIKKHQEEANIASIVQQKGGFGGQSTSGLTILSGGGLSQRSYNEERAHGGSVSAGRGYMWQERGDEYFIPDQKGRVVKSMDAERMSGGSNVTINGNITIETPEAANTFFDRLDRSGKITSMGLTGIRA